MKNGKSILLLIAAFAAFGLTSCGDDDVPPAENEEEVINQVVLTFTPDGGGTAIVATYFDADGEGAGNPTISAINLTANTTYSLTITMANTLESPIEDITEEVEEEGDEHMIFFSFTADAFSNPIGNGNIDNRADAINYSDEDNNGFPIGLVSSWTTTDVPVTDGTFRMVLKHQPDIKTATSSATEGESDIDITFALNIAQ